MHVAKATKSHGCTEYPRRRTLLPRASAAPSPTMPTAVSLKQAAQSLTEHWSPRVVAEVDDSYVKVAKVHGSLAWHSHDGEDELFLVLKGHLRIEMEDATVEL